MSMLLLMWWWCGCSEPVSLGPMDELQGGHMIMSDEIWDEGYIDSGGERQHAAGKCNDHLGLWRHHKREGVCTG